MNEVDAGREEEDANLTNSTAEEYSCKYDVYETEELWMSMTEELWMSILASTRVCGRVFLQMRRSILASTTRMRCRRRAGVVRGQQERRGGEGAGFNPSKSSERGGR
jgi:hypothetical protein